MNFELKELDYCKFELNCVLSSEKVKEKKEDVLKQFKNAPCPGYRKGKASREALLTYYKSQIEESLKRALAEEAFHDGVFDKELRPIGSPSFSSLFIKDGKFYCTFSVDVRPSFDLADIRSLTVPLPQSNLKHEDILNEKLEEIRNRFGDTSFFDENSFVQDNDTIVLDSSSFFDGNEVTELKFDSSVVLVGKDLEKDFSDNLLGMKLNEEREFPYKVTKESSPYFDKVLTVKAKVTNGTKTIPAPLDDTLAKKVGKESFNELREFVSTIATKIMEENSKKQMLQSVSNLLVESHNFKVQDWLLLKEAAYLAKSAKVDFSSLSEEDKNTWKRMAEKNVKLSFILDKVREVEPEAQVTDQEVLSHLKRSLGPHLKDDSNEALAQYLAQLGHYSQVLFAKIKDEYALNFVVKNVKVVA